MSHTYNINNIEILHHDSIINWKKNGIQLNQTDFLGLVEENHAFNYQLWHAEDRARRDDLGHEPVYRAKREIDHFNQQRNNRMESIDEWLYIQLQPASHLDCPVHSETPGMIIDRLSILSLKAYHMELQTIRHDVDEAHRQNCTAKLQVLHEQKRQLLMCLDRLLHEVQHKTRTFRIYRQFKMYNDPTLNPQLYQKTLIPQE